MSNNDSLGRIKQTRKRRHRQDTMTLVIVIVVCVLVIALLVVGILFLAGVLPLNGNNETSPSPSESVITTEPSSERTTEKSSEEAFDQIVMDAMDEAAKYAKMYDYDKATEVLMAIPNYTEYPGITGKLNEYQIEKNSLVRWPDNTKITHIFFHSLIVDPKLAFNSNKKDDYNQNMATITEFNRIMETMYENGYVLVSLHDIAENKLQEDGSYKMVMKSIYLPEGKKPFVLSQDDLCYYEYMKGHGFASRLVIAEDGSVDTEMDMADGTSVVGDYDMVPLVDSFVEKHPDFSYHGAKGCVALTGYNGVFGYRTSAYSYTNDNENGAPAEGYINYNLEKDRETAAAVAQRLRDTGWEIASHSWGHLDLSRIDAATTFVYDANRWESEVESVVGPTDIMIFPFGSDIGSWRGYLLKDEAGNPVANDKFEYLKQLGFNYFCNVDSSQYWVQINDRYFRMGRRNIDGQRLYEAIVATDRLSDLFDSKEIIDAERPLPVKGVTPTEPVAESTAPAASQSTDATAPSESQ